MIAESYAWFLRDHVRRLAEVDLLAPWAITTADLVRRPATINQTLLLELSKRMQAYYDGSGLSEELGGALVIGTDASGAHVYQVEHGKATFMDSIGLGTTSGC